MFNFNLNLDKNALKNYQPSGVPSMKPMPGGPSSSPTMTGNKSKVLGALQRMAPKSPTAPNKPSLEIKQPKAPKVPTKEDVIPEGGEPKVRGTPPVMGIGRRIIKM